MIGSIICWWTKKHKWGAWVRVRYGNGHVFYWQRFCLSCPKWETSMEKPE